MFKNDAWGVVHIAHPPAPDKITFHYMCEGSAWASHDRSDTYMFTPVTCAGPATCLWCNIGACKSGVYMAPP